MPEAVLDTMVLQALGFGHPNGMAVLLSSLATSQMYVPAEVYNQDEDTIPIERSDRGISELGRGLRFARRRAAEVPAAEAGKYQRWLSNARQLASHIETGELVITVLDLSETRAREDLIARFGISRGEAACLVVALRRGRPALFVSSDDFACRVAREISVPYITLVDVLEQWIAGSAPPRELFEELVSGMAMARFRLADPVLDRLRRQLV